MGRDFNVWAILGGIFGGVIGMLFGNVQHLMWSLCAFIVIDYITGIIKAIITKTLSSEIGAKGIMKKVLIFSVITMAAILQLLFKNSLPILDITIYFYIANEGLSILENTSEYLPIPIKLRETLLQLRNKQNDENYKVKKIKSSNKEK